MLLQEFFQPVAIGAVGVEGFRNIDGKKFFARVVAGHPEEGVVEIQEAAQGSGDEHAFLHVRNQGAVFFFGTLAVGDVFQDMDNAERIPSRVGERGIGSEEIAAQPGSGSSPSPATPSQ